MEELTALPGVGRKTANVVLSVGFGLPGLPVDTHVTRLSHRLALSDCDRSGQDRDRTCATSTRLRSGARSACASSSTVAGSVTPGTHAATSARSPTCARHGENSDQFLNIRRSPRHLPESLVTGWLIASDRREPRRYVRSRNRFPPPGSKTSGVRDPPPGPLPDGALGGAVGASGHRSEPWIGVDAGLSSGQPLASAQPPASMRSRRLTAPTRARSTAMRLVATCSRLATVAASASAVTRRAS